MAYTVLARRYRSQNFDDVVGQDAVAQTLRNAIESGRVAHAYLFCGTRGVGKTTLVRRALEAVGKTQVIISYRLKVDPIPFVHMWR